MPSRVRAHRWLSEARGYAIVSGLFIPAGDSKGGFLAKRTSNSAEDQQAAKVKRPARTAVREYVPIEDDPTVAGNGPEGAFDAPAQESAKPSMRSNRIITPSWKRARGQGRRWRIFCRRFAADAA